ncbi:VanZ family protein [Deinococcus altitudinis]|uniref:VanZ family protein n=1 Tax=Deinococcus altitudinis TaxID=468914 RepID=UPI0038911DB7
MSLLLVAVIWALSSSSAPLGVPLRHPFDWLGHTLEYLVLAYVLGRATGRRGLALGLAVWFGAADEVHQAFVAGRDAGIQDWLFGLLGALLGSRLGSPSAAGEDAPNGGRSVQAESRH